MSWGRGKSCERKQDLHVSMGTSEYGRGEGACKMLVLVRGLDYASVTNSLNISVA